MRFFLLLQILSLLGESPVVKDFWIAEAVWYTHAAGFAKIIAEWMDAGEPQQDVHEADLHRFYGHSAAKNISAMLGQSSIE